MKSSLTNRSRENPFKNKENLYNIKINKKVNRSIEKRKNFKTQMSFRIEKLNERTINNRKVNVNINESTDNNYKENK